MTESTLISTSIVGFWSFSNHHTTFLQIRTTGGRLFFVQIKNGPHFEHFAPGSVIGAEMRLSMPLTIHALVGKYGRREAVYLTGKDAEALCAHHCSRAGRKFSKWKPDDVVIIKGRTNTR